MATYRKNSTDTPKHKMCIVSGTAHQELAESIASNLNIPLTKADIGTFSDGETKVQIMDNVRGADVFIVQPTCPPVSENLMQLLVMVDALKRSSAKRITAVVPYYGYARQDRKVRSREPISAKLVADLLEAAGAHHIIAMDLHVDQIQGFFNVPVDHVIAAPVMLSYLGVRRLKNVCIVSPDAGGVERARYFAQRLNNADIAIIDKRREKANVAQAMNLIGDVKGKTCVIVDDIVDTAGSLVEAVRVLREFGADKVYACITHALLSGPAIERIENSELQELIVSNSIPYPSKECSKLTQLSVSMLLGETIRRIHNEESLESIPKLRMF